ncbi:zinc knuckle-domain-containing protein [Xylariaceae sp. FL0594]|nr:zinc knuckle-domain-containing protein [Xylariaceae sp. FL0594]
MFRRGPAKATPANVQCQKCLKRGHYSYECKASAQERPYIPRPSRTQQLLNPKLVPKLTNDTIDPLPNKKGLADEQLAKREAERAKKQALEEDEDSGSDGQARGRSPSYDSVSTISTRGPSSPARRRRSVSSPRPSRSVRDPSPVRTSSRRGSLESGGSYDRRYSSSRERLGRDGYQSDSPEHHTRSPSRDYDVPQPQGRSQDAGGHRGHIQGRSRRYSRSPSRSPRTDTRRQFRSRSPQRAQRQEVGSSRFDDSRPHLRRQHDLDESERPPRQDARERSLSPFSKRLALTQSMNLGRGQ